MRVEPRHILAFRTSPGEGSEPANFGFCRYPATVPVTDKDGAHRLATQLRGWSWKSFCKTQYASSPNCGGVQNFLRCHLAIVKLLDFAKATGLVEVEVHDEGGYWEARSVERLVQKIGQWNEFVAAVAGMMKDAAQAGGMAVEAAITGFPNFEHLEAKGREHLAKFHQQRKKPTD